MGHLDIYFFNLYLYIYTNIFHFILILFIFFKKSFYLFIYLFIYNIHFKTNNSLIIVQHYENYMIDLICFQFVIIIVIII